MNSNPTGRSDEDPVDMPEDLRDTDDIEQTDESTPAFDIDLDPEDQGLAGSGEEPSA
jgi:hypothetical protein